jgi:transposase
MKHDTLFVGLDVHKGSISIAVARAGSPEAAQDLGKIPNDVSKLWRKLLLLEPVGRLVCVYEAGPLGYGLARWLKSKGVACTVIAPSRTPKAPADHVKTDRRDAAKLAVLMRAGMLVPIYVPEESSEALRDLIRARSDAKKAQLVARHQLSKFLLRHHRIYLDGVHWTTRHRLWLEQVVFDRLALQETLIDYRHEVDHLTDRIRRLDALIERLTPELPKPQQELVTALQSFRGIKLLTAASIATELGDLKRFKHPKQLMSYLGLVPSEYSSGNKTVRGAITKTGNTHVRRLLIEATWSYRLKPRVSRLLRWRSAKVAEGVKQIAWKAQGRVHSRYLRLLVRGKPKNKALVAMARELAGFLWAAAQQPRLIAE